MDMPVRHDVFLINDKDIHWGFLNEAEPVIGIMF